MEEENKTRGFSFKSELFDWLEVVVSAIIVVVILFTFFFRIVTINGPSMRDTLFDKEKVIITSLGYEPKYGDIVVISRNVNNSLEDKDSQKPIIKRVIAVAGQTVDIDFEKGIVYVDGEALDEPYTREGTGSTHLSYDIDFPVHVPDGYVFCLGDNRNDSLDSRSSRIGENGMIDKRYILGHAVWRILPFSKFGGLSLDE